MTLFLASSNDTIPLIAQKFHGSLEGKSVLFIANASDQDDQEEGDKWWVRHDREAFEKLRCVIIDIDLRIITLKDFECHLDTSGILHFCGGSVLYLMSLIREKGFVQPILEAVRNNKVVYSGTSAGSMIAARDLRLSAFDPDEKEFVKKVKDFSGLGLVDFLIIPHVGNHDFTEGNKLIVEKLPEYNQSLIFLYDNQAVWVEDGKIELLLNY